MVQAVFQGGQKGQGEQSGQAGGKYIFGDLFCDKISMISQIENIKLVYQEFTSFSSAFPDPSTGLNMLNLYKIVISKVTIMSFEAFKKAIEFLEKVGYILKTGPIHFRSKSNLGIDLILDQVI